MDSEELDRWLDADLMSAGGEADGPPDGTRKQAGGFALPSDTDRVGGRRRPWKWIAATAVVVWLAVMVVWLGGGNGQAQSTEGGDPVASSAPTFSGTPTTSASDTSPSPSEFAGPSTSGLILDEGAGTSTSMSAGGRPAAALRARLTSADSGVSYLEWATVVDVVAMGAGIDLVVMDAIWLTGDAEGALDTTHEGRWAVPVADDGQVLASPWPHSPSPEQTRENVAPPVGTVRLGEVEQAVAAAGWTDVTVIGSDPHPLLTDAVTALVDGVPPGGQDTVSEVVWLQEDQAGTLTIPGAPIDEGVPPEDAAAAPAPSQKSEIGEGR